MKSSPRAAPYHVPATSLSAFYSGGYNNWLDSPLPSAYTLGIPAASSSPDPPGQERKLFVGMLSKRCTETDVRSMFNHFGDIEECTVLRDTAGQSKGCAFVTYLTRQCALNAIKAMHHSHTMEGCSSAIVVKFADTPKEKDQRRFQQLNSELWTNLNNVLSQQQPHTSSYLTTMGQQLGTESSSYLTQLQLLQHLQNNPSNLSAQILLHNSGGGLSNLSSLSTSTPSLGDISSSNLQSLASIANFPTVNPMSVQNLVTLAAITAGNNVSPTAHSSLTGSATASGVSSLNALNSSLNGLSASTLSVPDAYFTNNSAKQHHQKQLEGPEGANLFIYHLPADFNDTKLAETFYPFGNVISAKVYIDKETNMSKCFGFVSYDNTHSANFAIQNLNGFHIGGKKLKVEVKRKKPYSVSKPY